MGLLLVGSGLVAAVTGASWTRSLVLAAAIVFAALLALRAMVHYQTLREARVLIMDGGETVPLRVVARERRRLLSARSRERLASRFEAYARAASDPSRRPWGAPYPFADLLVARAVCAELLEVAALLRQAQRSACGVARAEHLLSQGFLITHGGDVGVLRDELRGVIEPLQAAGAARRPSPHQPA